jgi:hypothetical protein
VSDLVWNAEGIRQEDNRASLYFDQERTVRRRCAACRPALGRVAGQAFHRGRGAVGPRTGGIRTDASPCRGPSFPGVRLPLEALEAREAKAANG